ncbi:serine hydrolase domain-containing protein [Sphingobium sp. AN641]|uniref:serine hydrolase domain-containing protein n=1 Tax=Sphingobium sp. AN641 TaxID=3133443 RepID=UPI0030BEBE6F
MSLETRDVDVQGTVAPGYEGVREAFKDNLASGRDVGAGFAVYRNGAAVVDLWGGTHFDDRSVRITDRTLFGVNSTTKGVAAICIAMLVDRGRLDYETPVCAYWPEFAANGKAAITVGEMMSHQAGLVGAREPVTLEDFIAHDRVAAMLAAQEPFFGPGLWGYHALTIGTLADELVRRIDGQTIARFYVEEIASKIDVDIFLGLPIEEDDRYAAMFGPDEAAGGELEAPNPQAMAAALANPMIAWDFPNQRYWRAAGHSAAAGTASASALAKLYANLVSDGGQDEPRLLGRTVLDQAIRERVAGIDQAMGVPGRYAAGFRLNDGGIGPNPASFGHPGFGGSVAFADPARRIGVAYVTNTMRNPDERWIDPRVAALLDALYAAEAAC